MYVAPTPDLSSMEVLREESSLPLPLNVFLIRHGETEWTVSGRHTSFTEIELSMRGRHEAMGLVPRLQSLNIRQILISPRARARQTYELAVVQPVAEVDPDLSEWDYGDYEGQTSVEIGKARKDWNLFEDGCPNGESPRQVGHRADRLITRLRALKGGTAVFTHGQFGAVLGARWIGLSVSQARHLPLSTASLSVLAFDPHHPDTAVVELWNSKSRQIASATTNDSRFNGVASNGP